MRIYRYETIFVTLPDQDEEVRKGFCEKLKSLVTDQKGQVHVFDEWGRQKLAYEVKKQVKGFYHYLGFEGPHEALREVERHLRINESVMKFMSFRVDGEFDPKMTMMERGRGMYGKKGKGDYGSDMFSDYGDSMDHSPVESREKHVAEPEVAGE